MAPDKVDVSSDSLLNMERDVFLVRFEPEKDVPKPEVDDAVSLIDLVLEKVDSILEVVKCPDVYCQSTVDTKESTPHCAPKADTTVSPSPRPSMGRSIGTQTTIDLLSDTVTAMELEVRNSRCQVEVMKEHFKEVEIDFRRELVKERLVTNRSKSELCAVQNQLADIKNRVAAYEKDIATFAELVKKDDGIEKKPAEVAKPVKMPPSCPHRRPLQAGHSAPQLSHPPTRKCAQAVPQQSKIGHGDPLQPPQRCFNSAPPAPQPEKPWYPPTARFEPFPLPPSPPPVFDLNPRQWPFFPPGPSLALPPYPVFFDPPNAQHSYQGIYIPPPPPHPPSPHPPHLLEAAGRRTRCAPPVPPPVVPPAPPQHGMPEPQHAPGDKVVRPMSPCDSSASKVRFGVKEILYF